MMDLFRWFPGLAAFLPHIAIGDFPAPVERLSGLCRRLGRDDLFIKRDDLSAAPYGGNKVRKLEFLLAEALRQKAVRVITTGAAGSNHCLATALYAKRAGLRATVILFDQPASEAVRNNLFMDFAAGAEMVYEENRQRYGDVLRGLVARYERDEGSPPFVIPAGGSSVTGVLGYVNAAFELAAQIDRGEVPPPAAIHVALGTMGTAVGLALGLPAAGVKSRVVASRVVPSSLANARKADALCRETAALLRKSDAGFPDVSKAALDIEIRHDHFEPGYGLASRAVADAVAMAGADGIMLDTTYAGKSFAAFLADARRGEKGPLLFWNTKNSRPLPDEAIKEDDRRLPKAFWRYFSLQGHAPENGE